MLEAGDVAGYVHERMPLSSMACYDAFGSVVGCMPSRNSAQTLAVFIEVMRAANRTRARHFIDHVQLVKLVLSLECDVVARQVCMSVLNAGPSQVCTKCDMPWMPMNTKQRPLLFVLLENTPRVEWCARRSPDVRSRLAAILLRCDPMGASLLRSERGAKTNVVHMITRFCAGPNSVHGHDLMLHAVHVIMESQSFDMLSVASPYTPLDTLIMGLVDATTDTDAQRKLGYIMTLVDGVGVKSATRDSQRLPLTSLMCVFTTRAMSAHKGTLAMMDTMVRHCAKSEPNALSCALTSSMLVGEHGNRAAVVELADRATARYDTCGGWTELVDACMDSRGVREMSETNGSVCSMIQKASATATVR